MIFLKSNSVCLSTKKIDNKNKLTNAGKINEVLIAKIKNRVNTRIKTALIEVNSLKKNNPAVKHYAKFKK